MGKILVVGSLNLDLVCQVKYHVRTGETIFGSDLKQFPGGKGANQAYAASSLGGHVEMLGTVGKDDSGKMLSDNLKSVGVNVDHLQWVNSQATGTAFISVNQEGNNSIIVIPGANLTCNTAYIEKYISSIEQSNIVLLQMEIPTETIYYTIEKAREKGKTIIVNPAPAQEIPTHILKKIDYLTPNESELELLSGMPCNTVEEIESAAVSLLSKGVKNIIVTLGDKGALYMNGESKSYVPGHKVTAVDTTAAGDCFNGAFAVALSEGLDVKEAIHFANKAASISVTRVGAQSSIPKRNELI